MFSNTPFPHVIINDYLQKNLHENLINFWPEEKLFTDEIPGVKLFSLLIPSNMESLDDKQSFWKNFLQNDVIKIKKELSLIFYPHIYSKYKELLPDLTIFQLDLMTSCEQFDVHGMHTHHYHNPNWTFTMLLYLDHNRKGKECLGTNMFAPKNKYLIKDSYNFTKLVESNLLGCDGLKQHGFNDDVINARSYPEFEMEVEKTCNFENNKLFAFLDSPISYHGVGVVRDYKKYDKTKKDYFFGQRKILRMHVGMNEKYIEKYYGLDQKAYFDQRRSRKLDKDLFKKIQKEIEELKIKKIDASINKLYYYYYFTLKKKIDYLIKIRLMISSKLKYILKFIKKNG